MKQVAIINYGLGNLRSVYNALDFIGASPYVAESHDELQKSDCAILPGVGAFGDGMKNLREGEWVQAIHEYAAVRKKPFLGICLGMQLLASAGTEHGDHEGLGLIAGKVVRLETGDRAFRIPHIGWNSVAVKEGSLTYDGIAAPHDFYFVHSFVMKPENDAHISGVSNHGVDFTASVESNNIWGVQFHPEKSQKAGLTLLRNFVEAEYA